MAEYNFTESQQSEIMTAAMGLNYYGKRLDTARTDVAGQVADRLFEGSRVSEILAYLNANKPAPAAKAKKADTQEAPRVPQYTSLDQHFEKAPKVEAGTFIVFSVQNNAPICAPAMATARMLARHLDAELLPVSCTYKVDMDNDHANDLAITCQPAPVWLGTDGILVLGGDVIPTHKKPVNNAKLMSGDRVLTLIPHVKQQAESLARMKGQPERWAVSTGTLCLPRYRAGRAGSEASADHTIGFTVVHPDGRFDQVALNFAGQGYYRGLPINEFGFADPMGGTALVLGDIHAEKLDERVFADAVQLAAEVAADHVVLHDLLDFTSRNHHNRGSGLFLASQMGRTVSDDIVSAGDVLALLLEQTEATIVVVNSNHDRALDRWLEEADPRQDPVNLPLWCDLQKPRYQMALQSQKDSQIPLERALRLVCKHLDFSRIVFLDRDQSYQVNGVELGHHGDCGINGARGGYTAFERLGGCYVIGHSHSGYKNGKRVAVAGVTGSFDMGYNVGASSWSHSHVVVTPDGVPQILAI